MVPDLRTSFLLVFCACAAGSHSREHPAVRLGYVGAACGPDLSRGDERTAIVRVQLRSDGRIVSAEILSASDADLRARVPSCLIDASIADPNAATTRDIQLKFNAGTIRVKVLEASDAGL